MLHMAHKHYPTWSVPFSDFCSMNHQLRSITTTPHPRTWGGFPPQYFVFLQWFTGTHSYPWMEREKG